MYQKQSSKRPAKATESTRNTTPFVIAGVIIGVVTLIALLVLSLNSGEDKSVLGNIEGVVLTTGLIANQHTENPVYPDTKLPPPGGVHAPTWQNCGIYREPIEARFAVHSLEHGAVWLTYDAELPEDDVESLEELVQTNGKGFTLLSPYPEQKSTLVATAWGAQLEMDSLEDPRLEQFLDEYVLGPQTPERGASCTGAMGNPIQ